MMLWRIVLLRQVALQTDIVAVSAKLEAVGLVAIAASHTSMEHPALDEGAVLVNFAFDLTVRKIEVFIQERDAIVIADRLPVHVVFMKLAATRVASRAHLDLARRSARSAPAGIARRRVDEPVRISAFIEGDCQAFVCAELIPIAPLPCPRKVIGTRSVAGLASDSDLGVRRCIGPALRIVVLADVGGVTIRAQVIPSLIDTGPM